MGSRCTVDKGDSRTLPVTAVQVHSDLISAKGQRYAHPLIVLADCSFHEKNSFGGESSRHAYLGEAAVTAIVVRVN